MKAPYVVSAIVAAVALAGCSGSTTGDGSAVEQFDRVIDGKTVHCIFVDGYKNGGLWCDWTAAK